MWLTASDTLRAQGIGCEVAARDSEKEGVVISRCTGQEAVDSINNNLASPRDFLLIRGFCLWPKGAAAQLASDQLAWKAPGAAQGGLQAEIDLGYMEPVRGLPSALWARLLNLAQVPPSRSGHVSLGLEEWEGTNQLTVDTMPVSQARDEGIQLDGEARAALGDQALTQFAKFFFTVAE